MSLSALLQSVQDTLRVKVPFQETECRIMPSPKAYPLAPTTFCSVYGISWNAGEVQGGLLEEFGVGCTITQRIRSKARDTLGKEVYIKEFAGIESVCRKIMAVLQFNNVDVIVRANDILDASFPSFVGVLEWQGTDAVPEFVGPDWFAEVIDVKNPSAGLTMSLRFARVLRLHRVVSGDLTNIV